MARHKLPKVIADLKGDRNYKGKQEPYAPAGCPDPPDWLEADERAMREWAIITTELDSMQLLKKVDRAALALYCDSYSRYLQNRALCIADGYMVEVKGYKIQSPYYQIMNKEMANMQFFLKQYGLTAVARANLAVKVTEETKEEDPWVGFKIG